MNAKQKNKKRQTWREVQDKFVKKSALAVVLLDGDGLSTVSSSNNNSICKELTKSKSFAPKCEKFCGQVFAKASESKKALKFKCHAGLESIAVPFCGENKQQFVAITGRTFVTSEDYRNATERAISGDFSAIAPSKFFENVIMSSSKQRLEKLAKEIAEFNFEDVDFDILYQNKKPKNTTENNEIRVKHQKVNPPKDNNKRLKKIQNAEKPIDTSEWRQLFNSILNLEYTNACLAILDFLKSRYQISSLAWLENQNNKLQKILAIGDLKNQEVQISMSLDDKRLLKLIQSETSIELKERSKTSDNNHPQRLRLFPITIGGDVKSALVIGEKSSNLEIEKSIAKFCETVAFELEILRLRDEVSKHSSLETALTKFNDSLKMIDSKGFWSRIMQTTAELLQAERGSLLVYDEDSDKLIVKAAIGSKSDYIKKIKNNLGEKIAKRVWENGSALIVPSIRKTSVEPAPKDWRYKTESFISFPITIGERKIGVLNIADKVDGGAFNGFDVQLIQSIIPQIGVAIDHATLKNQAGEYKQLSVTDSLTGLLNKRYLLERLDEEIKRSNRHGYPMSFLMIDVDNFKSYNDTYLHLEGDKALQIVGHCLRETLRSADIAARYGGEEFSILLPQTTIDEAEIIAERIRTNVETTRFPNRQVTVSIGISSISLTIDTVLKLIESADRALFNAKRNGKNNVRTFNDKNQQVPLIN